MFGVQSGDLLGHRLKIVGDEAHGCALLQTPAHDLRKMGERTAADEEHVGRVELDELLLRVLAPGTGRRHIGDRALDDLEQRLLHAFTADITRDAGVVAPFARDLVDFINIDDAVGSPFRIPVGGLEQADQDGLHVLAYVARLSQRGGVGDGEGHLEQSGQGLGQQRLAAAGGTDQEHIALGQFDRGQIVFIGQSAVLDRPLLRSGRHFAEEVAGDQFITVCLFTSLAAGRCSFFFTGTQSKDPFVMVVDRDREHLFGAFLADDILIQVGDDLSWAGNGARPGNQRRRSGCGADNAIFGQDLHAEQDALVTDIGIFRTWDQSLHVGCGLLAEGTVQVVGLVGIRHWFRAFLSHNAHMSSGLKLHRIRSENDGAFTRIPICASYKDCALHTPFTSNEARSTQIRGHSRHEPAVTNQRRSDRQHRFPGRRSRRL